LVQAETNGGKSEDYIEHLDETCACLLPEEAANMTEKDYEEMLADLKVELELARNKPGTSHGRPS
jgi:hypothetical protein